MKAQIWSRGQTSVDLDPDYQEPDIRAAIEARGDVASEITERTDTERSNISHDEYAIITEDDGRLLWHGPLTGGPDAEVPQEAAGTVEALKRTGQGYQPPPPGTGVLRNAMAERLTGIAKQEVDEFVGRLEKLAAVNPHVDLTSRAVASMITEDCPEAAGSELAAACMAAMAVIEEARQRGTPVGAQGVVNLLVLASVRLAEACK